MARLGSTTVRAREMRRVLARWARSGLTQREFALQEGVPPSTIAWWRHVFRDAGERPLPVRRRAPRHAGQGAARGFVEVKIRPASGGRAGTTLEVVVRTGQVIRVPHAFDAATLRAVVAALESPC